MGHRKPISSVVLKSSGGGQGQIGAVHGAKAGPLDVLKIEADTKTADLAAQTRALETVLEAGLQRDPHVAVGDWRPAPTSADLPDALKTLSEPSHDRYIPPPLGLIERLAPGAAGRHAKALAAGEAALAAAMSDWRAQAESQARTLAALKAEADAHNQELEAIEARLKAGDPETVRWYAAKVLEDSPYPASLHREIEVGLGQAPRLLTVDVTIAGAQELVPSFERYRFAKSKGEIVAVKRSDADIAALYNSLVAQLALRSLHEIFRADVGGAIDAIRLRIFARRADPSTGQTIPAQLAGTKVLRADFETIDLAHVEPVGCFDRLKALTRARK